MPAPWRRVFRAVIAPALWRLAGFADRDSRNLRGEVQVSYVHIPSDWICNKSVHRAGCLALIPPIVR